MSSNFYKHLVFKKLAAFFLLCVFTLSITPKKTLHSLFANHNDNTNKVTGGKIHQVGNAGYNCNVDDLVAESNFITGNSLIIVKPVEFLSVLITPLHKLFSLPHLFFGLRGPPSLV